MIVQFFATVDVTRGDEVGPQPIFSAVLVDGPSAVPVALCAVDERGLAHETMTLLSVHTVVPEISAITASAPYVGDATHRDAVTIINVEIRLRFHSVGQSSDLRLGAQIGLLMLE